MTYPVNNRSNVGFGYSRLRSESDSESFHQTNTDIAPEQYDDELVAVLDNLSVAAQEVLLDFPDPSALIPRGDELANWMESWVVTRGIRGHTVSPTNSVESLDEVAYFYPDSTLRSE
jgi:hypothetical protein